MVMKKVIIGVLHNFNYLVGDFELYLFPNGQLAIEFIIKPNTEKRDLLYIKSYISLLLEKYIEKELIAINVREVNDTRTSSELYLKEILRTEIPKQLPINSLSS